MYLEYKHNLDKETAKQRIDEYISKLDNMQFAGGFAVEDLKKDWTNDEVMFSFNIKKMIIERRVEGNIKLKENNLLIMDLELPDIIKNFVTEENLEKTIKKNLDTVLSN
jgi:hypothetical protein